MKMDYRNIGIWEIIIMRDRIDWFERFRDILYNLYYLLLGI